MRPGGVVVVVNELRQNSFQMSFVENDDMIEAFSPQGSLDPLDVRVLPWASVGGSDALDIKVFQSVTELRTKS